MLITYNDKLRALLKNKKCILAYDTAADYLGLSNGGYRPYAQIFVSERQNIDETQQFVVANFDEIECENVNGLLCTTINQTIIDLLRQNGDCQIITESLANYYFDNGESFDDLKIPEYLIPLFSKYKELALDYYDE